jgi:hypothetical protein
LVEHFVSCLGGKMTSEDEWFSHTAKYLKARREAGTKAGNEYAARLAAMLPEDAAKEIYDMFALCFDEDLAEEIFYDLQLPSGAAEIAEAIIRLRRAKNR